MSHMVNEGEANDNYINGDNSQENVPAFFIHANAMRSSCVLVNWPTVIRRQVLQPISFHAPTLSARQFLSTDSISEMSLVHCLTKDCQPTGEKATNLPHAQSFSG